MDTVTPSRRAPTMRFDDPDALAAALPNIASQHFPLSGTRGFDVRIQRRAEGAVFVQRLTAAGPMLTRAEGRTAAFGLMLPDTGPGGPPRINGLELGASEAALLGERSEFAIRTPGACAWLNVVLPMGRFASLGLAAPPERRSVAALRLGAALRRDLTESIRALLDPDSAGALPHAAATALDRSIFELVALALAGAPPEPRAHRAGGQALHLVRQAEAFLDAHRTEAVYLEEVCLALGCAPRTLSEAFRAVLGVGPIAYLKMRRLSMVRQALQAGGPGQDLVKSAALGHGFWHLGHFARDYREMFGERPSETAARRAAFSG